MRTSGGSSRSSARTARELLAALLWRTRRERLTVAIPYLTGQAINAVRPGHHDTSAMVASGSRSRRGAARLAFTVAQPVGRRPACRSESSTTAPGLYENLQKKPSSAFFAASRAGQLMSSATVDRQAVRLFLGYGLVFAAVRP